MVVSGLLSEDFCGFPCGRAVARRVCWAPGADSGLSRVFRIQLRAGCVWGGHGVSLSEAVPAQGTSVRLPALPIPSRPCSCPQGLRVSSLVLPQQPGQQPWSGEHLYLLILINDEWGGAVLLQLP